jgi:membrane protein YdbS with pleckstrin-like domain
MNTPDPIVDPLPAEDSAAETTASTAGHGVRELWPHPALRHVWMLGTLSFVVPVVLVTLAVAVFTGHWPVIAISSSVGTLLTVSMFFYSRAWLARFRCRLLADGLWVQRGVWWQSETFVPRARVQHTDVQQGPIARRYGMASLKVFTAGASHGEVEIDGLLHADALWLRDALLGRSGRDGV